MVTQRKPKASKYLTAPIRPIQVDRDRSVAGLLEKMEGAGFGARQLAEAHRIWLDMLGDNTTIVVAASGALIPAGMRRRTPVPLVLLLHGCGQTPAEFADATRFPAAADRNGFLLVLPHQQSRHHPQRW